MSVVTRIRNSEELVVPFEPHEVWNVLIDLAAYPRWWPSKLDVEVLHEQPGLIGSEFEVRPWMGRAFRCRFEELNKPHGMRLRFFGGALEGPGGFLIQPAETGSGTAVRYEIDVFARGRDVALLSRILPLQHIHASQMRSLLQSLAKRLRNLERENLRMAEESARVAERSDAQKAAVEAKHRAAEESRRAAADEAARLAAAEALSRKAAEEEAARAAAIEAERRAEEDEARKRAAEDAERRRVAEEEAARLAAREAGRRAVEEAARKRAEEQEAALKLAADAEAARLVKLEAERRAAAEAARVAAEEAARRRAAEEEAARLAAIEAERRAADEAARVAAEEAARRRAEEEEAARLAAVEAERRAAEEAARVAAEEAARRRAAEEAEAARLAAIEAERRAAEEAARVAAEEAARRRAEEEEAARLAAVEAERRAAEEAARLAAEDAARRRAAEEEAARLAVEAERRAAEEAARVAAEEAARRRAAEEAEAARLAAVEAERRAAEESARVAAEESARRRAAEEEAARLAAIEAERRAAEEAARVAAEEAARRRAAEDQAARDHAAQLAARQALDPAVSRPVDAPALPVVPEPVSLPPIPPTAVTPPSPVSQPTLFRRLVSAVDSWLFETSPTPAPASTKVSAGSAGGSNFEIARMYLAALGSDASPEEIARFFTPNAVHTEYPHRFQETSVTRDVSGMKDARKTALASLARQSFDLRGATGGGTQVAMEVLWKATTSAGAAPDFVEGQELEARIALFLKFNDSGKIERLRSYTCFEPWTTPAEREQVIAARTAAASALRATPAQSRVAASTPQGSNFEIARRFLTALSSGADADAIAAFYAPDVFQEEFPNRLLPEGAVRDLAALQEGRRRGLALLASENYELRGATGGGSQVALEVRWVGVVKASIGPFVAGQRLEAHFGVFLKFRDGLIVRHHTYDCIE